MLIQSIRYEVTAIYTRRYCSYEVLIVWSSGLSNLIVERIKESNLINNNKMKMLVSDKFFG